MNQQQLVESIRAEFEQRLGVKSGWGKNEALHQFDLSVATVLLQDFADNRLPTALPEVPQRVQVAALAMQALIIKGDFTIGMGEPSRYDQAARQAQVYADTLLRLFK